MYEEIIDNLSKQLSKSELQRISQHTIHLGIFTEPYLTYILENTKTIESRFSKNRILPYENISSEDVVIIKRSGGSVVAYFTIKNVSFYDLSDTPIETIKEEYYSAIRANEEFWESKKDSRYATLIEIDEVHKLSPFSISKRGMQTWITYKK